MKIETFIDTAEYIDECVNAWLAKIDPDKIISVTQSSAMVGPVEEPWHVITVMIVYRDGF